MLSKPIVIVEDDEEDCELLVNAFKDIGVLNEFRCFGNGASALEYLQKTAETPFIIISDINMPKMNGLLFKKMINEDITLRKIKTPFVFLSTAKEHNLLESAFDLSIQGFFQKPDNINSLKEIASSIFTYWKKSKFNLQNGD